MAKKNKIYVTTMYRWADRSAHSYVHYAGFSKSKAKDAGDYETSYRGGKYSCEVIEITPDVPETKKIIYSKLD